MSCLPASGGCERHRTDPFVEHLNAIEGTQFRHVMCLDIVHRNSRQPEALYRDIRTQAELAIERKNVIWPADYAARHKNDHVLAEALTNHLSDIAAVYPISIQLGRSPRASRHELEGLAGVVSDQVRSQLAALRSGESLRFTTAGLSWRCTLDPEDRLDAGAPGTGLLVQWSEEDRLILPSRLPPDLAALIQSMLDSTVEKFRNYPDARGVLLVDQFGELRYLGYWWWSEVFDSIPVPAEISEVWLATYDWRSDEEQGWIFEPLHPLSLGEGAA